MSLDLALREKLPLQQITKKKGRPPQWSESWRKRLVTLRVCGIETKEALEIICYLSQGTIMNSKYPERRPQQILRELLSDGYTRQYLAEPGKSKERLALLNSAKKRVQNRRTDILPVPSSDATVVKPADNIEVLPGITHDWIPPYDPLADEQMDDWNIREGSLRSARVSMLSNKSTLRNILRQHGRTNSSVSGLLSLLSKFTFPNGNDDQDTLLEYSKPSTDAAVFGALPKIDVDRIRLLHRENWEHIRDAVLNVCCSRRNDCPHRRLADCLVASPHTYAYFTQAEVNERDPDGNNLLFFAAHLGARLHEFLQIIDKVDVNAVNADGQTFLFVLNPKEFREAQIRALVATLRGKDFCFAHTDNDGRTFLSYLSLHPDFSDDWVTVLAEEMTSIYLHLISAKRDVSGHFLVDYLKASTEGSLIGHPFRFAMLPQFISQLPLVANDLISFDALPSFPHDQDIIFGYKLRSEPVHSYPQSLRQTLLHDPNRYGVDGLTPLLRGARDLLWKNKPIILRPYDVVVINWNARDLDGRTILHYSTMKNRPDVLQQVLTINSQKIQVNHRDKYKCSALDYAVDTFNTNRRSEKTAKDLADSLKCIIMLVDHGALMTFSPIEKGNSVTVDGGKKIWIPETDPIMMDTVL